MGLLHRAYARSLTDVFRTENHLMHSLGLVRRPVAAQWLVTAACDMKCPHCYSAAGKRVTGELSTEEARRLVVDPLVELGCPLLVLAGGELLLRPDVPELVEYARSRGMDWAMHTHGMHVPRFRALLEEHPPVLAAISLDGDRSFHDAFRGRAGSFDAAIEAAAVLADAGCREVVLGTTVTRDNADRLEDLFGLVKRSRASSWGLHLFAPEGRGHDHAELLPTPGQLRRVAAFARRRRGQWPIELCNEWGSAGREDLYYRDQAFTCGAGSISLVISATGDVLPCTTTDPREREGNVRQTPLERLWTDRFDRFRTGSALVSSECWLQSRNGQRCAEHAFGPLAQVRPLWIERWPAARRPRSDGRRSRLVGSLSSAAVGVMATGLVVLQACTKPAVEEPAVEQPAAEVPGPAASVKGPAVERWAVGEPSVVDGFPVVLAGDLHGHFEAQERYSAWDRLRTALAECEREPEACGEARSRVRSAIATAGHVAALERHVDGLKGGAGPSFTDAIAVLDAAELLPTYDPWLAGHLWRTTRGTTVQGKEDSYVRVRLYARLAQHHRVIDALKRAQASHGAVEIRPWLKKSAPPPDFDRLQVPRGLARAARAAYPEATATTWETVALPLEVRGDGVMLARAGRVTNVARGEAVALSRLDVLWCAWPTTLRAPGGRTLEIPAGTELTLFELHRWLSAEDREAIEARVSAIMEGDTSGLDALEAELALAHDVVRMQLAREPQAEGAPALRQLLVVFDE